MTGLTTIADSDWELFSIDDDDDEDIISSEEMTEITEPFDVPDLRDDLLSNNETQISKHIKQEIETDDHSVDELINLEELYSISTPSSSLTLSIPHDPLSPPIPEYNHLQNLPNEIVERPTSVPFHQQTNLRTWVAEQLQNMLDDVSLSLEHEMPISIPLRNRHNKKWSITQFIPGKQHRDSRRFRTPLLSSAVVSAVLLILLCRLFNKDY